jgi:filamentous hemagglutinin
MTILINVQKRNDLRGINTNIIITDETAQQQKTGKNAAQTIAGIHTDITSDNYADKAGYLANNFDKDKVQEELDLQREVTQEFDQNRKELRDTLHKIADSKRQQAESIRKENYIDGKNGYNTSESLALEASADKLDKATFYIDMALGTLYGYGNTAALVYADGNAVVDPAVRAARRPIQYWEVKCTQDGLYCSNNSYDNKKKRPIDEDSPYAEIGEKRQIFDINEIKPGESTGVITISNPGILNPLNESLKNAVKQNLWQTDADGIYVIPNPPTGNFLSEGVYAFYDKMNDLIGGRLPLTNSEKANIILYQYAKDNGYEIDLSNHSRGGMTASVALQNANRNGLTGIPIREARFYGTATHVPWYANQLVTNGYEGSRAYSAVHYTDFVGRSPAAFFRSPYTIGGNAPTGGVENKPFMYSHSSYFREEPVRYLVDEKGRNIDANGNLTGDRKVNNPYKKEFDEKWTEGPNHNLNKDNPSLPVLVPPTRPRQGVK